jgi:formyltetrahydrofolate deformylase
MSEPAHPGGQYLLTLSCPDRPGLVYAVSSFLVGHAGNILSSQQFGDARHNRFFMRVHFEVLDPVVDLARLRADFTSVAQTAGMTWQLVQATRPTRTLVLVSSSDHCLNDLLYRQKTGALNIEIPAVVSNHPHHDSLTSAYGVPYHHVPVAADSRAAAEERLMELVDELAIDLVVLARYMRIFSPELCARLEGRAINIHHSFLPSFVGQRPYHRAHERGVKLIGATAHYVTADLDEGPIIEQDVVRADHSMDPEQLVALGRDVEAQVLSRAVKWHAEHRVLLNGNRTVVFR